MNDSIFSPENAIKKGWSLAKKNVLFFLVIIIILTIVAAPDELFRQAELGGFTRFLIQIVFFCAQILVSIGIAKVALLLLDGKKPGFDELYKNSEYFLRYLGGSLLYGLMTILGTILFIIPGIYLAVKYQFYYYYIIEDKCGPIEAFKRAGDSVKGQWWNVLWFDLTLIFINFIGLLALLIGFFWSYPTTMIAHADAYRQLRK